MSEKYISIVELPEGAVVENGLTIVSYLLPGGDQGYAVITEGSMNQATALGLLELGKFWLMRDS